MVESYDMEYRERLERLTRELAADKHLWRRRANSMPTMLWEAEPSGRLHFLNERWYEFTGMSRDADPETAWDQVHPEDRARVAPIYEQCFRDRTPYEVEIRIRVASGDYRWTLVRGLPCLNEQGEIEAWLGNTIDIHDLKMAQEALTLADQRKDDFLAMLAHELRNPMAPIANAATILGMEGMGQEDRDWAVATIKRQVSHMVHLVDDLLDVSRIMRNKVILKQKVLELQEVIFKAVETSKPGIDVQEHRFIVDLAEDPVMVFADEIRLAQVVSNLLNNASKYTHQGGRIDLFWRVPRDHEVEIHVRDTGVGIDPKVLPFIFDSFVQADRSLDRSQGGLGIGLAVVKELVHLHGGRVSVRSTPGEGSEFIVTLPALEAMKGAEMERARVLIVDDNTDSARSLGILLRGVGNLVRVAYSGEAGIEAAGEFLPHYIFLDIGLPRIDGYEVCRRLRSDPRFAATCFIAYTGYTDQNASRQAGFDEHLIKPADLDYIQEVMRRYTARCGLPLAG